MERDILPRDANKNEFVLNKSDTNERTHDNNLPEIKVSSNKVNSQILKENKMG